MSRAIRTKVDMVFLDNELDPNTGTIHARGLFQNTDRRFTPGMFARVKLIGSGQYDALLINDSAIGTDQSVKFVLRVGADNKIEYTPVKLGPLIDGLRVVREGLKVERRHRGQGSAAGAPRHAGDAAARRHG